MRNFFEHQETARRNTGWLLLLFTAAVCGIAASTYLITIILVKLGGFAHSSKQTVDLASRTTGVVFYDNIARMWYPDIFALNFAIVIILILIASAFRLNRLKSGGAAVAGLVGARWVCPDSEDPRERQLVNVVEEMSIASGVPTPMIYVMEKERGINAFAAGYSIDDAAVTVTRGMLDNLTRDEMQGVIAHEFSHIFSGDMRLNIHLISALFGILVLAVAGNRVFRSIGNMGVGSSRGGGSISFILLLVAMLMVLIGYIGLLFGRMIKAAVSRQREYLADAAAVQFTRNPYALAGALKKIGGAAGGSLISSSRGEEFSHLFFGQGVKPAFFSGLLATHPPLGERVMRLDPRFDGVFETWHLVGFRSKSSSAPAPVDEAGDLPQAAPEGAIGAVPAWLLQAIGIAEGAYHPPQSQLVYGAALLDGFAPTLRDALHNSFSACSLIFATLLDDSIEVLEEQYRLIRLHSGRPFLQETVRLEPLLENLDKEQILPLVNLALPVLRKMTQDQLREFSKTVEVLIAADHEISIFEYAITRTLLRRLRRAEEGRPRIKAADRSKRSTDLKLLLSILARESSHDEAAVREAFLAGANRVTSQARQVMSPLPREACKFSDLDGALDRLSLAEPKTKKKILDACAHCILADEIANRGELELLRVFADALDSPLPPLLVPAAV